MTSIAVQMYLNHCTACNYGELRNEPKLKQHPYVDIRSLQPTLETYLRKEIASLLCQVKLHDGKTRPRLTKSLQTGIEREIGLKY